MVYPTPQTVLMNFGFRLGSFIFSRKRAMCAMTVLFPSMYFSFQTASNNSSEEDDFPTVLTESYQRMLNSMGVTGEVSPLRVHWWLS